jgi:hypothetical protein
MEKGRFLHPKQAREPGYATPRTIGSRSLQHRCAVSIPKINKLRRPVHGSFRFDAAHGVA